MRTEEIKDDKWITEVELAEAEMDKDTLIIKGEEMEENVMEEAS